MGNSGAIRRYRGPSCSHLAPLMPDPGLANPGLLTACAPLAALIRTITVSMANLIFLILPYSAPYLAVQIDTCMPRGRSIRRASSGIAAPLL